MHCLKYVVVIYYFFIGLAFGLAWLGLEKSFICKEMGISKFASCIRRAVRARSDVQFNECKVNNVFYLVLSRSIKCKAQGYANNLRMICFMMTPPISQ